MLYKNTAMSYRMPIFYLKSKKLSSNCIAKKYKNSRIIKYKGLYIGVNLLILAI
jgi:hypothetical protein